METENLLPAEESEVWKLLHTYSHGDTYSAPLAEILDVLNHIRDIN